MRQFPADARSDVLLQTNCAISWNWNAHIEEWPFNRKYFSALIKKSSVLENTVLIAVKYNVDERKGEIFFYMILKWITC